MNTSILFTSSTGTPLGTVHGRRYSWSPFGSCLNRREETGFNGQWIEAGQGYTLGNGYRYYRPDLRRFSAPDSFAPFLILNSYAYCLGDPLNHIDPSGHSPKMVKKVFDAAMDAARQAGRKDGIRALRETKNYIRQVDIQGRALRENGGTILTRNNTRSLTIDLLNQFSTNEIEATNIEKLIYKTATRTRTAPQRAQLESKFPFTKKKIAENPALDTIVPVISSYYSHLGRTELKLWNSVFENYVTKGPHLLVRTRKTTGELKFFTPHTR